MDALRHRALVLAKGLPATPSNLARIAAATSDAAAKWAFGQWELRHRARHKFAQADQLFFTREALEQATHERVAQFHANLFPEGVTVFDLTTGIGSDLIALAARGPVHGFEVDRERAELAAANLRALGLAGELHIGNAMELATTHGIEYVFADPARRQAGARVRDREDYQPDPKDVIERFGDVRIGGIKLSPMLPDSELRELGPRVEFVSFGGECREALVMWGMDVEPAWGARNVETNEFLSSDG
ncbi:MAG: class I SAM-dependent methyltransferase, partial [Fimbriimonadaceae bacterium]|nr:class I SAM-dependent methyltransferase [Fimbriimonadaceae bacterium]